MVQVALAALLRGPAHKALRNLRPLGDAGSHTIFDRVVLGLCPRPLLDARAEHALPAVQALRVRLFVVEVLRRDPLPVLQKRKQERKIDISGDFRSRKIRNTAESNVQKVALDHTQLSMQIKLVGVRTI